MELLIEGKKFRIVAVNKLDCTSCYSCVAHLPQYFRMDDEDLSESHNNGENINHAYVPEEDWEAIQEQIEICPGECIHWKVS
ncbi:MAG: ferredoxin [Leptospiraceae bacterium]|nr:ferredoxin [Leptospiraceae bacterium]MDW7975497.1 ferredoxin [Leptospiraceae bacterium]